MLTEFLVVKSPNFGSNPTISRRMEKHKTTQQQKRNKLNDPNRTTDGGEG